MIRVVKVGGSLFSLPELPQRLSEWLAAQSPAHHVLLAGGGPLVESLRELDKTEPIDPVAAHWMCIDVLTVTAHLLHAWLPEIPLVEDDCFLCQRVGEVGATIFGPAPWLRHSEPALPGTWLMTGWDTTSDAIAARLAISLRADEFVMLKSRLPKRGSGMELSGLSAIGYVDPMIAQLASELPPTRLVNMRTNPPSEKRLPRSGITRN